MTDFKSYNDFDLYKKGLETRINQLEDELKDSPKLLMQALNPFSKTPKAVLNDDLVGDTIKGIHKASTIPIFKGLSSLTSLLPIGLRVVSKVVADSNMVSNVLHSIIRSTELTASEERMLAEAELEEIKELEQQEILTLVEEKPSKSWHRRY